ncbi:long-chain-fatty-acid--CoA ligase 4 [Lepeophtheirus salmonis]|uniref:long-chain-fatty-acid--CoA ligase 4 n=1 Tax=Lepeophtheirus salmonis TaxID=72036 RepID=UPI003AF374BD
MDLGIEPRSRIAILSESRQEWVVSMYAAFKNNYTLVTLYTNLGNDAVEEGLNETEVPLVIVSDEVLPKFKGILEACPLIKYVVVIEAGNGKKSDLSVNYQNNFQFIMYRDLLKRRSKKKYNRSIPSTNDTAIIMYTSGSTGRPKGVMVNHGDAIAGLRSVISYTDFTTTDRYLAYLPLAHIMEIVAEMACLYCGVKIGYSSPLTLTDNGSKVKKGCKGDANVFKPTLMCAVPLLLQRIYKGIIDNMRKKGWAMEELFNYFVAYKIKWQDRGFDTPLLNKTLFRTVRYFLGGRVRLLLNGGAPISHETHLFTRTTLSVPVLQAYGLTELSGAAAISNEYDFSTCRVGPPLIGVKVKLVNWEEGGYTINDKPFPRGEIHCGGESLCQGYFKNPEKTADDFYEEDGIRWFKTGDIGQMEADGVLKLVDRKKDLVKLSGGEYISYGKVESILKTCPFIENICTYADPLKDYLFAIAIPDKAHVNQRGLTQEDACKDPSFISSVTKEIGDYGLKNGLVKFEVPAKILFVSGEWTTDNGLITAAFKTRRRPIVEYYRIQVDKIYC